MEQVKRRQIGAASFLQAIIVIYTFSSVCGKMATNGNEFMSRMFIIYILLDFDIACCLRVAVAART